MSEDVQTAGGPTGWLGRLAALWLTAYTLLDIMRGVLFIAALVAACGGLLLLTPQGQDLALTIAEGGRSPFQAAAATALASLCLGGEAWFWSRRIIDEAADGYAGWKDRPLLVWTPRMLGALPATFAGLALARAGSDLHAAAAALLVLAGLILLAAVMRRGLLARAATRAITRGRAPRFPVGRLHRTSDRFRLLSYAAAVVGLVVACLAPVALGRALGGVGVVYTGCALIIPPVADAIHRGRRLRLPVSEALLVWAAALSALGVLLGDNHAIGRRASDLFRPPAAAGVTPPSLSQAFDVWYAQAPGPPGGPKPMVVVAVEGGASRAGYWSAELLGRLQDQPGARRPFSDSVFALSSVSGGSVGAAAFVSQLQDTPAPAGGMRIALTEVAHADFLSPALVGLLFPDLLQRFLPVIPLGGGRVAALPDRAEALELAFEDGWRGHCRPAGVCRDPELWGRPLMSLVPGVAHGRWTPILIINGAREEDGRRVLTATVEISPDDFPDALDFHVVTSRDVRISTAIHNGARFPLVSPGGAILGPGGAPAGHVLDGGYFEGSGLSTAMDLIHAVERLAAAADGRPARPVRPIVLEINNDSDLPTSSPALSRRPGALTPAMLAPLQPPLTSSYFLADLLGPVKGMAQSRDGHGHAAAAAAGYEMARRLAGTSPAAAFHLLHLCQMSQGAMPMDWALSRRARKVSAAAASGAEADRCGVAAELKAILLEVRG